MEAQNLELARQKYAKKLKTLIIIPLILLGIAFLIAVIGFMLIRSSQPFGILSIQILVLLPMPLIIGVIIGILGTRKEALEYKRQYKAYFIEKTMQKYFTNLNYSHDLGMPKEVLSSTGMIRTGDRYSSNDYTSGQYKDVAFRQADVKIEEEHRDSDSVDYITIFKGRWLEFEFPKSFNFRLEVIQKWFNAAIIPRGQNGRKFIRYETESTTFNQKFKVYAEDGFETFYLLDPTMIERIEELSNLHKAKYLFCFTGQKLSVAIHDNKDAFEPPSPFKPIDEAAEIAKVEAEINLITSFVDYLKLNRKLFKK
ncbi:DUF3137 domain-containing protein [Candidatus Saccharibacteria bacterium]|nr:DUF3137 domain-containing protein [Candidatus Saccharibacteria bacterium]